MFKIAAIFLVLLCVDLINLVDSQQHSVCERRHPTYPQSIVNFKCPPERVWFGTSFLSSSSDSKKIYCCGTIENRYCCKKSEAKKDLIYKQQRSNGSMSSISSTLFTFAFIAIVFFICCRCFSMCFRKKRLNTGAVITTSSNQPAGILHGQNVHVISQPAPTQPPPSNQPQFHNPYQQASNQYPAMNNQYPPINSPYPATGYPSNQYPDFNQPPPAYQPPQAGPVYPPPFQMSNTNQTSANDSKFPVAPSAPEF